MRYLFVISSVAILLACQPQKQPQLASQHPSPMVDYTRPHHRVNLDSIADSVVQINLSPQVSGTLYLPPKWQDTDSLSLLMHFHGDARVAQDAVSQQQKPWLLVHFHWGNGSGAYRRPVSELGAVVLLDSVKRAVQGVFPGQKFSGFYLSAWSAGYGAVRSLISQEEASRQIKGILLMDGLHCSYVPEGKVLSEGGTLDSLQMQAFTRWAQRAASGKKNLPHYPFCRFSRHLCQHHRNGRLPVTRARYPQAITA
jgi:hypothetical protein